MTIISKFLQHFPKPYLLIIFLLILVMTIIGFWSGSDTPAGSNSSASISQTLDLSLKLQAATPQPPTQPKIEIKTDKWTSVTVKSGDSLSTLFQRIGLSAQDVYQVDKATNKSTSLRTLFPGDSLDFLIVDQELQKVRHIKSPLEQTLITRQAAGEFSAETITRKAQIDTHFVQGVINNSLFLDGQRAGLSQRKLMELANIFGWDIDFALDIREQDQFALIYEEHFLDDKIIGEGNILAAQFTNRGEVFNAIRHSDGSYYSPKGYSMRKAFLRSPVDFYRISSKYNPNRKHPVLKTSRPHRGVDYAASTGTPIKASGDGKVIWRGTKGGYGRTIILQHAGIYTTLYAHMSKYNSKVKKGSRVKQGQVIGYIGSSGLVTGPHLHYEFRSNGVHKDPLKVKFPNVQPLNKTQMEVFKPMANAILAQLESYRLGSPLASNQ
jgi:murein DD-endopeptidase MepM/ murein hydrolase activator NlpD